MKKILFTILMMSTLAANASVTYVNPYWLGSSDKAAGQDNLNSIDSFLDGVVDSSIGGLNDADNANKATRNGWHFAGYRTALAVGMSGNIGIVAFGGTKSIKIDWMRNPNAKKKEEALESSTPTITINENTSKAELDKALQPVIKNLVDSKKITDEKEFIKNLKKASDDFYDYSKGLSTSNSQYKWYASKMRLNLIFSASGKLTVPVGVLVKLGGDVRLRLEFVRIMSKDKARRMTADTNVAKKTKEMLNALSYQVTKAYENLESKYKMQNYDMKFDSIKVGIGMSVGGSVGLASLKGSIIPEIYFKRQKVAVKADDKALSNAPIYMLDQDNADKGLRDRLVKMNNRKVRKGMAKAMKFANKFARKISKKAAKKQKKGKVQKWVVKKIESNYTFNIGGTVGLVKITASPTMSLYFSNKVK